MDGAETIITHELMQYRAYSRELLTGLNKSEEEDNGYFDKHVMVLEERLSVMDSWLSILDMYESFVLILNLMKGRTLSQTADEYILMFGSKEVDENSVCRIRARAIAKIVELVSEDPVEGFWLF